MKRFLLDGIVFAGVMTCAMEADAIRSGSEIDPSGWLKIGDNEQLGMDAGGKSVPPFVRQSGAGAIQRSLDSKNKERVSVRDFGAVCDGKTDNGLAFQKAAAAAPSVSIPTDGCSAPYIINTTVILPKGFSLFGDSENTNGATTILTTAAVDTFVVAEGGGNNSISNISFVHSGSAGKILNLKDGVFNKISDNTFSGTNAANADSLIYTNGSNTEIFKNAITNNRTNALAIELDRTAFGININDVIAFNYFGGAGKGIKVGASQNANQRNGYNPRPEGILVTKNRFIGVNTNLLVQQVLYMHVDGNIFDQGARQQIVLQPAGSGIDGLEFDNNYISTPNQPANGVCLDQDNSLGGSIVNISVADNYFAYCGRATAFAAPADHIIIADNNIGYSNIGLQ